MSLKRLLNPVDDDDGVNEEAQIPYRRRLVEPEHSEYADVTENHLLDPGRYFQDQYYANDYDDGSISIDFTSLRPDSLFVGQSSSWQLPSDSFVGTSLTSTPLIHHDTEVEEENVSMINIETSVQDEKICYGMFFNEKVQLVGDSRDLLKKIEELRNGCQRSTHTLRMEPSTEKQIFIKFPDGTDLGLVCEKIERGLKGFINESSVEFDAEVDLNNLVGLIRGARKQSDGAIRVNINVYGPESKGNQVGRKLSNKKLFLQEPNERRQGMRYDNPHILSLDGLDGSDTEEEDEDEDEVEYDISNDENSASLNGNGDFQETIGEVFSSLRRSGELHRLEGSESLNRALFPHQEEALDFMLQRETGKIPPQYCLWKPKIIDGEQKYCHAITMAQEEELPDESGGGILADEMGMGKSLTTLVLIEKTANSARQWAEEQKRGPAKQCCRATLVIVPSLLLINTWMEEIKKHLSGNLNVLKYHGSGRKARLDEIDRFDIIITTYNTLQKEYMEENGKPDSPMHRFEWYRVVLDEAHIIRRPATTFHQTVASLSANIRWCLTGTPIQNSLSDLGALLAFLHVKPFHNLSLFRYWISTPFEKGSTKQKAIERLSLLLEGTCLRRTIDRVNLPGRREETRFVDFSPDEHKQYEDTRKAMQRFIVEQVGEYAGQRKFGMFQFFLELRSICNHGTYQSGFSWAKRMLLDEEANPTCSLTRNSLTRCLACRQPLPIISRWRRPEYVEQCKHVLCEECSQVSNNPSDLNDRPHCPICKSLNAPGSGAQRMDTKRNNNAYWGQDGCSSKIIQLVSDVEENLSSTKSIIFSCWIRTIELIEVHLKKSQITFARIDGNTPATQRQKILDEFDDGRDIPVLIMTTGIGAFGLNLQSANRVFIVEPQWNPSVESQAVARAIRLGQEQQVLVVRYRVKDSIEETMYDQQTQKLKISKMDFKKDLLSNRLIDNSETAMSQVTGVR